MTTLSPTQARSNLTAWLKKASLGEDVGILYGDKVIALRPVQVASTDYVEREYDSTRKEVMRALGHLHAKGKKNRKAGKSRQFTGDIEALLQD